MTLSGPQIENMTGLRRACREQVYEEHQERGTHSVCNTAYNVWYPHGFMHTHDILEALTPIEVESQNETCRMHALMTGEMS